MFGKDGQKLVKLLLREYKQDQEEYYRSSRDVTWNVSTLENHTPIQQRQNSLMSLDINKYFHPQGIGELCAIIL